jgi:hypothetical protein
MAHTSLEDQALDFSKPFVIELSLTGADGRTYRVEKETYPLKSTVKSGRRGPWDAEVRS